MQKVGQMLSPLDDRYAGKVGDLRPIFSEYGLVRNRVFVEVEYLISLLEVLGQKILRDEQIKLQEVVLMFGYEDYQGVKSIERSINHDVKAVEYWIGEKLEVMKKHDWIRWVHFGLTSEDVNNLAQSKQLKDGNQILLTKLKIMLSELLNIIRRSSGMVMLARTHGQPAVPTTMGKELAVYLNQLLEIAEAVRDYPMRGKMMGAVGTLAANKVAYPEVDWLEFSGDFVSKLGFENEIFNTQVLASNSWVGLFSLWQRMGLVIRSMTEDLWWYVSGEYIVQKAVRSEVGSSTMPQKVNPIRLENAEGNSEIAASMFSMMVKKFSHSRLQRDLSDSTVRRNFGVAYGHLLLAVDSVYEGLLRMKPNAKKMKSAVEEHPEVLAEAYQTMMRKEGGGEKVYEVVKDLFRGNKVDEKKMRQMFKSVGMSTKLISEMMRLSSDEYVGYAEELVKENVSLFETRISKLVYI